MAFMDEDQKEFRASFWHTAAHLLGHAVLQLYPDAKRTIGPAIENGFYYDFYRETPFTPEDLKKIEHQMKEIARGNHPLFREDVPVTQAKELSKDNPFKLELIDEFSGGKDTLSFYCHADYKDLCKGGHIENTGDIKAIKILKTSGAYWRGNANNPQLQRIYGIAFPSEKELKEYLTRLEEAEKRSHVRLGQELDLFSTEPEMLGGGLILWHPKGALIRYLVEDFCMKEHLAKGYDIVSTPHIGKSTLWKTSGHLEFYKESMYSPLDIDGQEYYLKPMNCPFHIMIYKNRLRSYRDLPLRYAEWGTVYRYEMSGVLNGLLRVRGFTQDDAHHFVQPEKMPEEIDFVLNFCLDILRNLGLTNFEAYLSTRPEGKKAVGAPELWEKAQHALEEALKRAKLPYKVDAGGGAFYGPKIDLKFRDALNREWQLSTIQFDFNLPERFDISYIGEDGQRHQPYMVHRALLGSMERFLGTLIEHYAGRFPLWLNPVQVKVLNLTDNQLVYAQEVTGKLKKADLRVELDDRSLTLGKKIREAQLQQVNYILVVGDKEIQENTVNIRTREGGVQGTKGIDVFIGELLDEVAKRR